MTEEIENKEPSRKEVWKMFDRIAHRYDLLNRLLSMGQDITWRKRMANYLPEKVDELLDLATGTGDQIIFLRNAHKGVEKAIGIDMSEGMLEHGREKITKLGWDDSVSLQLGDAMKPPFEDNRFDAATISFGIRNVIDVSESLTEMARVLKPGGKLLVLECSLPPNVVLRKLYLFYFRHILPLIGGLISGDSYAYNYLNKTVETFPCGEAFNDLMRGAGFTEVKANELTFGIATIYEGVVPL